MSLSPEQIAYYRSRGMTYHQRAYIAGTLSDAERLAAYEAHVHSISYGQAPLEPYYQILPDPAFGEDHLRRIVDAEGDTLCVCPTPEIAAELCAYLNRACESELDVLVAHALQEKR